MLNEEYNAHVFSFNIQHYSFKIIPPYKGLAYLSCLEKKPGMKHKYTSIDWELLARHLTGELSPVEQDAFNERLAADAAFNQWVQDAKSTWELTGQRPTAPTYKADQPWAMIAQKIQPTAVTRRIPFYQKPAFQIAAVLALLVSTFGVWKWNQDTVLETTTLQATAQVQYVQLPDGSEVWLNANSTLTYPHEFTEGQRVVALDGEAFFEVEKDPSRPFIIKGAVSTVQVLGTSFDFISKKNVSTSSLSVKTGKVLFFEGKSMEKDSSDAVVLMAGNHADLEVASQQFTINNLQSENHLAWKTGKLTFENTPLAEVISSLETHYKVSFDWQADINLAKGYTGTFEEAPLDTVIATLSRIYQLDISISGNKVIVK